MKIKRNASCPCGSGRKYKHCCLKKKETMSPRAKLFAVLAGMAFIGIVIFGVVALIQATRNFDEQPLVNRVWSEEHQHWHYTQ